MNKSTLTNIFTKKTSDYSFTIMFFIIFSLFIVLAIKPSLTTATALKKEQSDLEIVDNAYENKIIGIANIQQAMEDNRNDFPLLTEAIASYPKVNKMIEDIKSAADQNSFVIKKASVADVDLFEKSQQNIKQITVLVDGEGSFDNIMKFTQSLYNQRRLKTIPQMDITQLKNGTDSATLKVTLSIEGYYL